MLHFKLFTILVLSVTAIGCVTSSLQIETTPPGAEVFISVDQQPPKKIGQSPMNLGATDLAVLSESFLITMQKPGFKTESVLVSSRTLPYRGYVGARLQEEFSGATSTNLESSLEEVARGVARVLDLIRSKEYEQALNILSGLTAKYSTVSTLYGLEGNIYYLQKNIDRALASYQKANRLSASTETQRMINRLEELRGRSPSSSDRGAQ
jgi:hypothetical protein